MQTITRSSPVSGNAALSHLTMKKKHIVYDFVFTFFFSSLSRRCILGFRVKNRNIWNENHFIHKKRNKTNDNNYTLESDASENNKHVIFFATFSFLFSSVNFLDSHWHFSEGNLLWKNVRKMNSIPITGLMRMRIKASREQSNAGEKRKRFQSVSV